MEWWRKSRNSKIGLIALFGCLLFWPQPLWSYGYQYMKDYRERDNRSAAKLFVSEDRNTPQAYGEMGPIKTKSDTRENCIIRLRRRAWRKKADGIIAVKYSAETLSNQITCEGTMVRWKSGETQPAETQGPETQATP